MAIAPPLIRIPCQSTSRRLRIAVRGVVQGVGFRPFVYRLATGLNLNGWVNNSSQGVMIEVEGEQSALEAFLLRLEREKPAPAFIQSLEPAFLDAAGYTDFSIRPSDSTGEKRTLILPDLATCPECLRELFDPTNRRHRYPFTNCTFCGPRFSIITELPYDRPSTTMKRFNLCDRCRAEYENPQDRRFHAQPNACPDCGPHLELWDSEGKVLADRDAALIATAQAIREGKIVAVKGIGGFHLMADARNEDAIRQLRVRKRREEKPFALMAPSLESIRETCEISVLEERLLCSPEAPIVLLNRCAKGNIAPSVAPNNPTLGFMLPANPLHHLLMAELSFPVVATSGNLSDEPICTDESEVVTCLGRIADLFLIHNRPITRHIDDSIARIVLSREMMLRRARGYAPLPITMKTPLPPAIAVGGHLKNTVAISVGKEAFISQHIGDLETAEAYHAFTHVLDDLTRLYDIHPETIVCDLHPDYLSTRYAERTGLPIRRVQHHAAHIFSCMAENDLDAPVLGISWDGTGYGEDGTIWGGEFLRIRGDRAERFAHLRPFCLPGGDKAAREPRLSALSLLCEIFGEALMSEAQWNAHNTLPLLPPLQGRAGRGYSPKLGGQESEDAVGALLAAPSTSATTPAQPKTLLAVTNTERQTYHRMLARNVNAPVTTSMGRLFDAVASLCDLRQIMRYEGQAAMELEAAATSVVSNEAYPWKYIQRNTAAPIVLDWEPLIRAILADVSANMPIAEISARFHNALAEAIVEIAQRSGEERIVLSGGCFLNRRLLETTVTRLQAAGFLPYWHQRVPPGDGGIALGQLAALRAKKGAK